MTLQEIDERLQHCKSIMDKAVLEIGPLYYATSVKYCQLQLLRFRIKYYNKSKSERLLGFLTRSTYPNAKDYEEFRTFYLAICQESRKGVARWIEISTTLEQKINEYMEYTLGKIEFEYVQ